MLQSLRPRFLSLSHTSPLSGHPGHRHIYNTMQRDYYWPNMDSKWYITMSNCHSCVKAGTALKHKRLFQLFPETGPVEYFAMDFLGLKPETTKGHRHVLITTDKYSRTIRAVPTAWTTLNATAYIFFAMWVVSYCISAYLLFNQRYTSC